MVSGSNLMLYLCCITYYAGFPDYISLCTVFLITLKEALAGDITPFPFVPMQNGSHYTR